MAFEPSDRVPSLSAVITTLRNLQDQHQALMALEDDLLAKRLVFNQKLDIALEVLVKYTADIPPAPYMRFPELNHYDDED